MVYAAVEDGTFTIDHAISVLGDHEDKAASQGHFYSNKAPGGALLGLPAYAFTRMMVGPPSAENMRVTLTAMRLLASTLPVLLLAIAFASVASGRTLPLIALLFGTPLFAYGMLNFSHALTAAALFGAWMLLHANEEDGSVLIATDRAARRPAAIRRVGDRLLIGLRATDLTDAAKNSLLESTVGVRQLDGRPA